MDRRSCEHAHYPAEVLSVVGGEKKVAHCLGCGRSGPVRAGSTEAVEALREEPRRFSEAAG